MTKEDEGYQCQGPWCEADKNYLNKNEPKSTLAFMTEWNIRRRAEGWWPHRVPTDDRRKLDQRELWQKKSWKCGTHRSSESLMRPRYLTDWETWMDWLFRKTCGANCNIINWLFSGAMVKWEQSRILEN